MSSSSSLFFSILQNPSSRTAVVGLGYADLFSVVALSSNPIAYKWQHSVDGGLNYFDINPDGGVFAGSRTSVLGVNAGMTDLSSVWNGARFRCVVESGGQTIVSSAATLTVKDQTCNGVVECGGSIYSADCGLLPMPGYSQYMDCTACECVAVALASSSSSSDNESSSSSSSFSFTGFIEFVETKVSVNTSSSSSSSYEELFVFAIEDPQLSAQIEVALGREVVESCYYVAFDEQCPEGYLFRGFADGCIGVCDKLCCPNPELSSVAMVCGRVYSGFKGYNSPWGFYLDPSTIRLAWLKSLGQDSLVGLSPSEIDSSINDGSILEGSECCFPMSGKLRSMEIQGPEYCFDPFYLESNRTFDPVSGKFAQSTYCAGACKNRSGDYCLDNDIFEVEYLLDSKEAEIEMMFASMSEEESDDYIMSELLQIFDGIDDNIERVYTPEEMEQIFLSGLSSSSSSVASNTVFDYNLGLPSTIGSSPSEINIGFGYNFILTLDASEHSYFSFSVPADGVLSSVSAVVGSPNMVSSVFSIIQGGVTIASSEFGYDINSPLFLDFLPLGPGNYSISIHSPTPSQEEYVIFLVLDRGGL